MTQNVPFFDPKNFKTEAYLRRIEKPWGYELHWVPEDAPYMGKIEHLHAGARMSLQVHDQKQESWFLMNGKASVIWENNEGELIETELEPGKGYSITVGQKHRLKGITDCDIIEVSTKEAGTTWRLEDDYARPNETPEQRALERAD
ncbi:MAG TPA: cupin [Candidatus Saccharibacteria bacterium]|jgi:mannose-6-phosphate isomerase|nr:cupin [Candidatus Saccharibacteria bacterium]HMT55525.1 cupin [Candidatus Saccharibacteria bacterium]